MRLPAWQAGDKVYQRHFQRTAESYVCRLARDRWDSYTVRTEAADRISATLKLL